MLIVVADDAVLLREGDQLRPAAHHGPIPFTFASQEISRGWASGRAAADLANLHNHAPVRQ